MGSISSDFYCYTDLVLMLTDKYLNVHYLLHIYFSILKIVYTILKLKSSIQSYSIAENKLV